MGESHGVLGIGPVIVRHQLDLFPEQAALLVHFFHGQVNGVLHTEAIRRGKTGERGQQADLYFFFSIGCAEAEEKNHCKNKKCFNEFHNASF